MGRFVEVEPTYFPRIQRWTDRTPASIEHHLGVGVLKSLSDAEIGEAVALLSAQHNAVQFGDFDARAAQRDAEIEIAERLLGEVAPAFEALAPFAGSDNDVVRDAFSAVQKAHGKAEARLSFARKLNPRAPRTVPESLELALEALKAEHKKREATRDARVAALKADLANLGVSL